MKIQWIDRVPRLTIDSVSPLPCKVIPIYVIDLVRYYLPIIILSIVTKDLVQVVLIG